MEQKGFRYPLTSLAVVIFIATLLLSRTDLFQSAVTELQNWGYVGMFFVGMFFVSSFTVGPAAVVLFHLGSVGSLWVIALVAGIGAAFGDLIIFRLLKDGVYQELAPLFSRIAESRFGLVLQSTRWKWVIPVLGAIVIASPFPDEVGIALMGLSALRWWQFLPLAVFLNSIGIFVILFFASSL